MEKTMGNRSANLKFFLIQKRIKVEELQKMAGWSRSTTFRKLKGSSSITDDEVRRISQAFNVSEDIFDYDEDTFEKEIVSNDNVPLFLENVNKYIESKRIRKDFIAKRMSVHVSTLERYLKDEHYVGQNEMVKIAKALKKSVEFFLETDFTFCINEQKEQIAYFSGQPSGSQLNTTNDLIEFINYHDALISITKLING